MPCSVRIRTSVLASFSPGCQRIEDDIEIMTEQVRKLFSVEKCEAQYNKRDFARRLILFERVFDAVQRFKELV